MSRRPNPNGFRCQRCNWLLRTQVTFDQHICSDSVQNNRTSLPAYTMTDSRGGSRFGSASSTRPEDLISAQPSGAALDARGSASGRNLVGVLPSAPHFGHLQCPDSHCSLRFVSGFDVAKHANQAHSVSDRAQLRIEPASLASSDVGLCDLCYACYEFPNRHTCRIDDRIDADRMRAYYADMDEEEALERAYWDEQDGREQHELDEQAYYDELDATSAADRNIPDVDAILDIGEEAEREYLAELAAQESAFFRVYHYGDSPSPVLSAPWVFGDSDAEAEEYFHLCAEHDSLPPDRAGRP